MGLLWHTRQVPECETHRWQFLQAKHRGGMPLHESGLLHLQGNHGRRELGLPGAERYLPDQQTTAKLGVRSRANLPVLRRVMLL